MFNISAYWNLLIEVGQGNSIKVIKIKFPRELIDSKMLGAYRSDRSDMEMIINDLSEKRGRLAIKSYKISYKIHTLSGNIWEEFAW